MAPSHRSASQRTTEQKALPEQGGPVPEWIESEASDPTETSREFDGDLLDAVVCLGKVHRPGAALASATAQRLRCCASGICKSNVLPAKPDSNAIGVR